MRALYLTSVTLHILAAATWVGGMVVFVVAVMPYFRDRSAEEKAAFLDWFGARFRAVSWTAIAVLAVTGVVNLWARGVGVNDVMRAAWWTTPFGHALGVKLVLVGIALAIMSVHERMTAAGARWLGRSLLLVAVAIIAAAVMLVREATPAGASAAGPVAEPAQWFVQTGCTSCHSLSVYGVNTVAATAPDLSIAVEDVPRRFGRSLEDFLAAPTGTMAMVLSSRIHLTPAERAAAVARLREAHRRYRGGAARPDR